MLKGKMYGGQVDFTVRNLIWALKVEHYLAQSNSIPFPYEASLPFRLSDYN